MTTVNEIMVRKVQVAKTDIPLIEAINKMKNLGIGCLVVVKGSEAVGMVTTEDILFKGVAENRDLKTTKVEVIMSRPLVTISPNAELREAAETMTENKVKKLPVVADNGALVGIVTATDLIRHSPEFANVLVQLKPPPGGTAFGA